MKFDYFSIDLCSCHVTYAFQSESTLYSCLNVKELLVQSRHEIWSLSDHSWTRTQNHLVHTWTFNHLAKLFVYELSGSRFESSCSQLFLHWLLCNFYLTFLLIFSIMIFPSLLLVGFIEQDLGLILKCSLWSFSVI